MDEDSKELTRSPQIQKKIESVRGQHSIEAAKELRMEILLENAKILQTSIRAVADNPALTREELNKLIDENCQITHKELTNAFLQNLYSRKNKISLESLLIKTIGEIGKDDPAKIVYRTLITDLNKKDDKQFPTGQVKLIELPLALGLEVEKDEDYKLIDPGTNIGGEFFDSVRLFFPSINNGFNSPVIIINGFEKIHYIGHENIHAENQLFMQTLIRERKCNVVWGPLLEAIKYTNQLDQPINYLINTPAEEIWKNRKSPEWEFWINFALTQAKDEILAEIGPTGGNIAGHLGNLLDKNGQYNYFSYIHELDFATTFNIGDGLKSNLGDELWKDYTQRLKQSTKTIEKFHETVVSVDYFSEGWYKRYKLLGYILAQIPIQDWEQQLEKTGFAREIRDYESIQVSLKDYISDTEPLAPKRTRNEKEKYIEEEAKKLQDKLDYILNSKYDKPIQQDLAGLIDEVNSLFELHLETDAYKERQADKQFQKLVESINNKVNHVRSPEKRINLINQRRELAIKLEEEESEWEMKNLPMVGLINSYIEKMQEVYRQVEEG
jgi:hypothetical protein